MSIRFKEPSRSSPGLAWEILSWPVRTVGEILQAVGDWVKKWFFTAIRLGITIAILWALFYWVDFQSPGRNSSGLSFSDFVRSSKALAALVFAASILGRLWSGPFSDFLAGIVLKLIDDPDNRPLKGDPMDRLCRLIHGGRIRRARRLCKRMLREHEGSRASLETTLIYLADRKDGKIAVGPRTASRAANKPPFQLLKV
jgi:hypothetical protein